MEIKYWIIRLAHWILRFQIYGFLVR